MLSFVDYPYIENSTVAAHSLPTLETVRTYWEEVNVNRGVHDQFDFLLDVIAFELPEIDYLFFRVFFYDNKCCGVVPFAMNVIKDHRTGSNYDTRTNADILKHTVVGEDVVIGFTYHIVDSQYTNCTAMFPTYFSYDVDLPANAPMTNGVTFTCRSISLPDTFDAYIETLPRKARSNLRIAYRDSRAFTAVHDNSVPTDEEFSQLLQSYLEYWNARDVAHGLDIQSPSSSCNGIREAFIVYQYAQLANSLRVTRLYDGNKLIAVNFSVYEDGVAKDYACIRSIDEKYTSAGLGIICTVLNIERAITEGIRTYDMGAGEQDYKKKFANSEKLAYGCSVLCISDILYYANNNELLFPVLTIHGTVYNQEELLKLAHTFTADLPRINDMRELNKLEPLPELVHIPV